MRKNYKAVVVTCCLVASFLFFCLEANAASKYRIRINKQQNCVTIYELSGGGKYKPIKAFVCSTGYATPLGTFGLKEKIRWHVLDGPVYGQYCTRITGHVLFHSVWYYVNGNPATLSNTQYNRLGETASHGCVRLSVRDAKWIFDNVPSGTPVTVYNSKNPGPLGKPVAIKLPEGRGWDPTDVTNPNNPYNKKRPVLKIRKGKNIPYASKFDLADRVAQAKNTTGFDAKDLVTYTIRYRLKGTKSFKKVKTINTLKPGDYKVNFRLTDEINRTVRRNVTYKVQTKVSVKGVFLNKTSRTLYLGGTSSQSTYQLKITKVTPKNASIQTVKFSSSDPKVVTVSKDGLVKAKKSGVAEVTALAQDGSGKKAVCRFTVCRYASSVALSAPVTTVGAGQTMALVATVSPSSTTNQKLSFASSDAATATVDENGVVTGIKPGTVTITATTTDGTGKRASITITVASVFASLANMDVQELPLPLDTSGEEAVAKLPSAVPVVDTNGNVGTATVQWTIPNYNPSALGRYEAEGTLTLPEAWMGNAEIMKAIVVVVEPVGTTE